MSPHADHHSKKVLGSEETLDEFLEDVTPNGVLDADGGISDEGGLNIQWAAHEIYVDGEIINIDARETNLAMTDNDTNYLYGTSSDGSTMQVSTTEPSEDVLGEGFALVATIYTYSGDIEYLLEEGVIADEIRKLHNSVDDLHSGLVKSGLLCEIATDATNPNDFTISAGAYYLHAHEKTTIASTLYSAGSGYGDNNIKRYYHSAGSWTSEMSNGVDFGFYDDGTNKAAVGSPNWYVAWIFLEGSGTIDLVYPQTQHANENDALEEQIVYPPSHQGYVIPIAKFVFRGGETAFSDNRAYFKDIRPFHDSRVAAGAAQSLWSTISSDAGSTTANDTLDTLTIAGSANQIDTAIAGDTLTIGTPQDIATGSAPTFDGLSLTTGFDLAGSASLLGVATGAADNDMLVTQGYVDDAVAGAGGGLDATNGADNRIATFTDADSLNGEANFTFDGTKLLLTGTMYFTEQAAAAGDTAAQGQLWVKNAAPCELWFTDDDGGDTNLLASAAGFDPDVDAFNIGNDAVSSGTDAISLGHDSSATATGTIAIGHGANCTANYSVCVGELCDADQTYCVNIGYANSKSTGGNSVLIGKSITGGAGDNVAIGNAVNMTTSANSVGVGDACRVDANNSVALGASSYCIGADSFACGRSAWAEAGSFALGVSTRATGANCFAACNGANALASGCIAIGKNSIAGQDDVVHNFCISIGEIAEGTEYATVCVGYNTTASGNYNVSLGITADCLTGYDCIAMGRDSQTTNAIGSMAFGQGSDILSGANYSIALGILSQVNHDYSVAIGYAATTTANYQIMLGNTSTTDITVMGGLYLEERANAEGDKAGFGQLWTKDNGGTTEIWFTDDSGTDNQLAYV